MPENKMERAKLLSTNPGVFNGQPRPPIKTLDIAKAFKVDGMIKAQPIPKTAKQK